MTRRRYSGWFWAQLAFTLLVCAFLIVPVGMSMLAGVTKNYFIGIQSGVTLEWVVKVWTDYRHTIFLSIKIALACLACTLLIGVPAAYVLARTQNAFTRTIEELLVMPIAVPGLATALALIVTYGTFGGFRRSWLFILVGHVLFTLPFMVRSVLAVMMSMDLHTLEEAIRTIPDVVSCHYISGTGTFELQVVSRDQHSFSQFAREVQINLPNVKDLHTSFSLGEVKASGALPLAHLRGGPAR